MAEGLFEGTIDFLPEFAMDRDFALHDFPNSFPYLIADDGKQGRLDLGDEQPQEHPAPIVRCRPQKRHGASKLAPVKIYTMQ
jgi:hypothetical protein